MRAGAAGAGAEHVALDPQRVGELESLGGGRERVRHRDVDADGPSATGDAPWPPPIVS